MLSLRFPGLAKTYLPGVRKILSLVRICDLQQPHVFLASQINITKNNHLNSNETAKKPNLK